MDLIQNTLCQTSQIQNSVSKLLTCKQIALCQIASSQFHYFKLLKFKVHSLELLKFKYSFFQISKLQSFILSYCLKSKFHCVKFRGIITHHGEAAPNSNQTIKIQSFQNS